MSRDDPGVLARHGRPGVPLAGVLHEGVPLVHRAAHDLAVLGEDGLDVGLGDHGRVEVADEDAGVEGARVILVGHVAGLVLPSHPRPAAGDTHPGSDGGRGGKGQTGGRTHGEREGSRSQLDSGKKLH